jgi:acyl-CoA thioesterase
VTLSAKEQLILDIWAGVGDESAGAAELELIQEKLLEQSNTQVRESPASIARTLADHGVRLRHPEILEADLRWRESREMALFAPEELNFTTIESAAAWVEKLSALEPRPELRSLVLQVKTELELVATSKQVSVREKQMASEIAEWLTIWLQNPPIFSDWLALRRESPDFRERFG